MVSSEGDGRHSALPGESSGDGLAEKSATIASYFYGGVLRAQSGVALLRIYQESTALLLSLPACGER